MDSFGPTATRRAEPVRSDDGDQDIGLAQHVVDVDTEIDARRNTIDVAEDGFLAVTAGEPVEDSAGHRLGIGTALGNGDHWHQRRSCRSPNMRTSRTFGRAIHRYPGGIGAPSREIYSMSFSQRRWNNAHCVTPKAGVPAPAALRRYRPDRLYPGRYRRNSPPASPAHCAKAIHQAKFKLATGRNGEQVTPGANAVLRTGEFYARYRQILNR